MARIPTIGGNWKLNLAPREAADIARQLVPLIAGRGDTHVVLYPTAIAIPAVLDAVAGSGVEVGIQDVHDVATGAFTGANSASLARAAGVTRALVGHSERRQVFGDDDATVNRKVHACFAAGVLPTLCIGETLAERDAGQVEAVLTRQLAGGLAGLSDDQVASLVLAYEPVWAIGTGRTASPEQAQAVHHLLRAQLRAATSRADAMTLLYGGSVKPDNASILFSQPDIDGGLVGGASLKAADFVAICRAGS